MGKKFRAFVVPLEQEGQLWGILGVENSPSHRVHSVASLLQTLSYFIMLAYRRKENEQKLSRLSYYDTLTSFYNRNRYMKDTAALASRTGSVGIVYLDVNGLKDLNDQQGHAYGDQLLIDCANQIRSVFQDEADYYRIGGDELVIICSGIEYESFQVHVAELRRLFQGDTVCQAAIGAQWDTQLKDLQQIIAKADASMYADKKEFYRKHPTSQRYRHHSDEMIRLSDAEILQDEIQKKRFVVYLQPKISSSNGTAVGAEALIRYQTHSGSLVLPGNFLPILEESQTISQIDFYVFEYACSQLKEWMAQGKQTLPVSVNFSRCTLAQPDFVEKVSEICEKHGVEKKFLEIELTEISCSPNHVKLQSFIHNLRQKGFAVSLDDFGAKYANLALLSAIEFDILKLDKSLVVDVVHNAKTCTVVKSIVEICKKLKIQVIAEGIETEEQLKTLRACGIELVQGFIFSKPMPTDEYEEKYL